MTKKLTVLFVLAFFAMSLGSLAFGAKAQADSQGKSSVNQIAVPKMPASELGGSSAATYGKPATSHPTSMGYYMLGPGEVQVGSSDWDWMNPESPSRRVAIGTDGKIHTVWTYRMAGTENPTGLDLFVYYNGYQVGSTPSIPTGTDMSGPTGCFPAIGVASGEALAIATYGYNKLGTGYDTRVRTAIGKQAAPFSPVFNMIDYPSSDSVMTKYLNCQNIKTGLDTMETGYYWPRIAIDVNGSGQTIAHVVAGELANRNLGPQGSVLPLSDSTGKRSIVYYRTPVNAAGPGACGTFIDSTDVGRNWDVVASPVSNKVAVIYFHPLVWTGFDRYIDNDDIYYKESSNLGDPGTWSASRIPVLMPGKTDSVGLEWQRADQFSALYDDADCLHVIYATTWHDPAGHFYLPYYVRLYHWSSCNPTCLVMMVDGAATFGSATGATPDQDALITSPSLTMCKVGAATRLYAVYTMYPDSSAITGNTHTDYSVQGVQNADVIVQGSTDMSGELWGPQVNITNTNSQGCDGTLANCNSESWSTSAIYVNDSLRIQYMIDKDPGHFANRPLTEGTSTDNPMVIKTYPCFTVPSEAVLTCQPASIEWPFHTTPSGAGHTNPVPVNLVNTGNLGGAYTTSVDYTNGSGWLSYAPSTGTVPAGCSQSLAGTLTATGPATEGLFRAILNFNYTGGKNVHIHVDLYNFAASNWFIDENNSIHTSYATMSTNQTSRVGRMRAGAGWNYESDGTDTAYFYDGSLFLGKDSLSLSMDLFSDTLGGVIGHGDTLLGRLFCLSNMVFDEVGVTPQGYRHSSGKGCNKDSTIEFDVDFYAPKHVDSSHFMIGKFQLYSGPKAPAATIPNVMVAYTMDMDVPGDSNVAGVDAPLQMVYQQGKNAALTTRFGAMAGLRGDNSPIAGGMVLMNRRSIHRLSGYVTDSIWTTIKNLSGFIPTDSVGDLHSLLVFDKAATITPKATGVYTIYVLFAGQPGHQPGYTGSLDNLKLEMGKAKKFMCNWLSPNPALCIPAGCTSCGDANNDGAIDIADAVFLITYIFKGGTAPVDCNYANGKGDANGDLAVDIADAVYLITYIFKGGALPHCNGM